MTINRTKPNGSSVPGSVRQCIRPRETIIWFRPPPRMPRLWPLGTSSPRSLKQLRTYCAIGSRYRVIHTFGVIGARTGVVSRACQSILHSTDTLICAQPGIYELGEGTSRNELSAGFFTAYGSTIIYHTRAQLSNRLCPRPAVQAVMPGWATVWSPANRSVIFLDL